MLKIKDYVDLKELEEFGFIKYSMDDEHIDGYEFVQETENEYSYLLIYEHNKEIKGIALDILYDLIQANIVEKVDGK